MHERKQRLLCRLGFLLLCFLPTTCSLGWIAYGRSEHYELATASAWQATLADWSGLRVDVQRVRHPRPGVTLLEHVSWSDVETGQPLAVVRLLELKREPHALTVTASQPMVHAEHLSTVVHSLHDRMLKRLPSNLTPVEFTTGELTLQTQAGTGTTLLDVRGAIESAGSDSRLAIDFRVAGLEMSDRALFRLTRRRAAAPVTTWEFHTGATSLPCAAAAGCFGWFSSLGEASEFRGSVSATRTAAGWAGNLSGQFAQVDLDRLLSQHFPHKLSGLAEAFVKEARFDAGRLTILDAAVVCRGGMISQSLVDAATRELRLRRTDSMSDPTIRHLAFDQLALHALIDERGLALRGICTDHPPRTLLTGQEGPILLDSEAREVSTASLVRMLGSWNDHHVPATRETALLFRVLPLPPIMRDGESDPRGHVPVRLQP